MSAIVAFDRLVHKLAPRTAIVLGSGLGTVSQDFREQASIDFRDIPGLPATTVQGHIGRLAVGFWEDVPTLLFLGRLHLYEGNLPEVLTVPVQIAAECGVRVLVLTNASGGINSELKPGSLMGIRQHIKLLSSEAWRSLVTEPESSSPYSGRLLKEIREREANSGRDFFLGVYAALTGPSYETPAEIRALGACHVDAVGMSTALEAEAAAALGLEVVGISCVTNVAAGLNSGLISHEKVLENAKLGVERLVEILSQLVRAT